MRQSPTRATPNFGQMAFIFPRFLAQIHHVSAQCSRSDWNFSEVLLVVAEVHGEKHLTAKRKIQELQHCPCCGVLHPFTPRCLSTMSRHRRIGGCPPTPPTLGENLELYQEKTLSVAYKKYWQGPGGFLKHK